MDDFILKRGQIGPQLETKNPFLVTMYHLDTFPMGNGSLGPLMPDHVPSEDGDFDPANSWHWYYGDEIPGFPKHPHRGFEVVTVVEQGMIDHADGLGGKARYGNGDTQWMSAGKGLQHSEMMPLLHTSQGNTLELFQIWLNLPSSAKLTDPDYVMLWNEEIPVVEEHDAAGRSVRIKVIAGSFRGRVGPKTPRHSWAADPENHVSIWLIRLESGAELTLPAVSTTLSRSLYAYRGAGLMLNQSMLGEKEYAFLDGNTEIKLINLGEEVMSLLLLEGEPIPEPAVMRGPFVMNTQEELYESVREFTRTEFGGWPYESDGPTHGTEAGRFAVFSDRHEEKPDVLFRAPLKDEA